MTMRKPNLTAASLIFVGLLSTSALAQAAHGNLIAAVLSDDHDAVRQLIAAGADPNAKRPDGSSALAWAVDHQNLESVKLLLAAKADANLVDQDGIAPLAVACERGDPAIVTALIDAKAKADNARPDSIPAIALCAANSTPVTIERLVAAGADANAASAQGQTPLMFAAAVGNIPNLEALVKAGGKINQASKVGFTPMLFAAKSKVDAAPLAVIKLGGDANYAAPDGTTALEIALLQGQFTLATQLVNAGGDLNHWDANGRQPLHIAAIAGEVEFAKLLLAKGAKPDALTKQPYVIIPNGRGRERVSTWPATDPSVKVVLAHRSDGAGPPAPAAATTPLMLAAQYGQVDMMKVLVSAGAKPDYKAPDGLSLMTYAVNSGRADAVRYAITLHPDINAPLNSGQTAVHLALSGATGNLASQQEFEVEPILRLLAENGADLTAKNAQGQTALAVAARSADDVKALFEKIVQEQASKKTASIR
jgi:ankyrin repeat protein